MAEDVGFCVAAWQARLCTNMCPCDAVEGVLKGYDQLLNLVLDETVEYARGAPRMHASSLNGMVLIALAAFWVLIPVCMLQQTTTTC